VLSGQGQPLCPEQLGFPKEGPILRVPQDFPTIQAAINAAPDEATIQIAPGTYTESLVIRKSVRIQGVARDHVVLKSANQNWSAILIVSGYGVSAHESLMVVIENLTIAENPVGVEVIGVPFAVVQHNAFRDNGTSILTLATAELLPFSAARGGGAFICGNIFEDGRGIYAVPRDQHYLWIIGNSFRNLSEGIRLEKSYKHGQGTEPLRTIFSRVHIQKNTMEGLRSRGVILLDSAGVMIEGNIIEGSNKLNYSAGVVVSGSEAILEGNVIRGHRRGGIEIGPGELLKGRALLKGNRIENNGKSEGFPSGGVVIGLPSRAELIENRIADNAGWGILVGSPWSVEVCQGNQVIGNGSGDYGWFYPRIAPQPSPELKQKCEGS
jgi:nitrous oxidase accessory protein NosD